MYAYIRGTLAQRGQDSIVLEAAGVGYQLAVTAAVMSALPEIGKEYKAYTYFLVREDAHLLYGFDSEREKAMFEKLLTVSGVGARYAMSVLSTLSPADVALAIATSDAKSLIQAPGVGRKLAERIILELREKVSQEELTSGVVSVPLAKGAAMEAVVALQALGYDGVSAGKAVKAVAQDDMDVKSIIREALRGMDRG